MSISIGKVRELLAQPPTEDTAKALKEWRAQAGYSQSEAAIRLGVPVRTFQGWELGRPMPYPSLLQRAVNIPARSAGRYALAQSDFPREFAEFIDFVGGQTLDKAIQRIDKKLGALSPDTRLLYGDRYFFQEQCTRFTFDSSPFQLDISNPVAVRAASLMGGINRLKKSLSPIGVSRLHAMVIDNLKLDRDMRQLEHEIRCSTHFVQKGFKVQFADLENLGEFDLLVNTPSGLVEVECKTVTEDTGMQIKTEMVVNMSESFRKTVAKQAPVNESGLLTLTLNKAAVECKHLPRQLEQALCAATGQSFHATDFELIFSPRPAWQELLNSDSWPELYRRIRLDSDIGDYARCIVNAAGKIVVLDIRPHAPSVLRQRLVGTIKQAADQCTGKTPGMVWLHFVGFAERDFLDLCEFSMNGTGAGLNAIVADALHPDLSSTDRSHIGRVRFSGDSRNLARHPMLDPNLLLRRAVSHGGPCYDVPNPRCRLSQLSDL